MTNILQIYDFLFNNNSFPMSNFNETRDILVQNGLKFQDPSWQHTVLYLGSLWSPHKNYMTSKFKISQILKQIFEREIVLKFNALDFRSNNINTNRMQIK